MTEKGVRVVGVADMSDSFNSNNIFMSELREAIRQKFKETHSTRTKAGIALKRKHKSANSICGT